MRSFISRHPVSPLAPVAQGRLETLQQTAKGQEEKARAEREAAQKRVEEQWNKIKDTSDQAVLQAFIKSNPSSLLAPTAQKRLEFLAKEQEEAARTAWDKIKDTNDQAALQSFIAGYPKSPLASRAQSRLETLQQIAKKQEEKARVEWDKIKDSNDRTALQAFIKSYPSSPLAPNAQSRLETAEQVAKEQEVKARAEWDTVKDSKDPAVLQAFVKSYPSSPLAPDAQNQLQALLIRLTQIELSRLGCYAGDTDGTLNSDTKRGIGHYLSQRGRRGSQVTITESFLSELHGQQSRICPLECPSGQTVKGDTCVATDNSSKPSKSTRQEEEIPRKPKAGHASSRQEAKQTSNRSNATYGRPHPQVHQEVSAAPRESHGGGGGGTTIGVGF